MFKLRKLLSDSAKAKRHRRNMVNLQITFLAWLIEVGGFLIIFLGTFILGHENNIVNLSMQTFTLVVYFNILPCMFLINDFYFKSKIIESNQYNTFLNIFNCQYTKPRGEEESAAVINSQMHDANSNEIMDTPDNGEECDQLSSNDLKEDGDSENHSSESKEGAINSIADEIWTDQNYVRMKSKLAVVDNHTEIATNDVMVVDIEV